jgi:single-stranded DNA-binding protein
MCKKPNLRQTPMGRQICDMMLAVNRRYGRSDYLPCIAWGRMAEKAAQLEVGDQISLEGRLQSRKYIKTENGVSMERTAFEVSIIMFEPIEK